MKKLNLTGLFRKHLNIENNVIYNDKRRSYITRRIKITHTEEKPFSKKLIKNLTDELHKHGITIVKHQLVYYKGYFAYEYVFHLHEDSTMDNNSNIEIITQGKKWTK